jgi:hypothetical protein
MLSFELKNRSGYGEHTSRAKLFKDSGRILFNHLSDGLQTFII